jgi:hypothetical protein
MLSAYAFAPQMVIFRFAPRALEQGEVADLQLGFDGVLLLYSIVTPRYNESLAGP